MHLFLLQRFMEMKQIAENETKLEEIFANNHITSIFLYLKTENKPLGVREIQ